MKSPSVIPNLSKLQTTHENQWVALAPHDYSVIASGKTLADVREKIASVGTIDTPVFFKVLPADVSFSPWTT